MRKQLATDFKPINFMELFVRLDGCELQYLIKKRISSGRFSVVEYQIQCALVSLNVGNSV